MKKIPNNLRFKKSHKIKNMKGNKGTSLNLFTTGVRLKSNVYLSYEQLEATRRVINRLIRPKRIKNKKLLFLRKKLKLDEKSKRAQKKKGIHINKFLRIRSNICNPLTKKPLQVRMGKGKGAVYKYIYAARKSRIIFELSRQKYKLYKIYRFFNIAKIKMPVKMKFIYTRYNYRRENRWQTASSSKLNFLNITYKR